MSSGSGLSIPYPEIDPNYPYPEIPCFLTGTRIAVPGGERAVESLAVGDEVVTVDDRVKRVKWVGRKTVSAQFADPLSGFPVLISAGALGDGVPARDLYLSPDHALALDGVLVHASALVNGVTVQQPDRAPDAAFAYWHVELDAHELIVAEGAPVETFVDNVTRHSFDNWAEYDELYPDDAPNAELPLPRIKLRRQLSATLRARLQQRAAVLMAQSPRVA